MATHLLADLHLAGPEDPHSARLIDYLRNPARRATAVYVLGDLFDVWIGDDGSLEPHRAVIDAFAALADAGVSLFFIRGNRDFGVGEAFVAASGFTLLNDPSRIDIEGCPTLLCHGDLLCSDDRAHQRFRAKYTDPAWRARMGRIPLWLRRRLALRARRRSQAGKAAKPAAIMDVNTDTVVATMREHAVHRLIHGHTHRPADHRFEIDGRPAVRHVLADWRETGEYLCIDGRQVERRTLP